MPNRKQVFGILIVLALVASYYGIVRFFSVSMPSPLPDTALMSSPSISQSLDTDSLPVVLQPFDPNTADSMTLRRVGLQPWQVRNMLRYRAKHGVYRQKEDLKQLYGMTDSLYQRLEPYIFIDPLPDVLRRDSLRRVWALRDSLWHDSLRLDSLRRDSLYRKRYHIKKDTVIELNSADTNTLQYIKGIGRYAAMRIVAYRRALGGYVRVEQVREIAELESIRWDSVLPHLTVCADSVKPIPVNTASIKRLQRHPYLSFTEAKAIYTLRRRRFRLHDMSELQDVLSTEQQQRLAPYMIFTVD